MISPESLSTSFYTSLSIIIALIWYRIWKDHKLNQHKDKENAPLHPTIILVVFMYAAIIWPIVFTFLDLATLVISGNFSLENELKNNTLGIRIIAALFCYELLSKSKTAFTVNLYQLVIYSLSLSAIWLSIGFELILLSSLLSITLLYVFDDWSIIADYIGETKKIIHKHFIKIIVTNSILFLGQAWLVYEILWAVEPVWFLGAIIFLLAFQVVAYEKLKEFA